MFSMIDERGTVNPRTTEYECFSLVRSVLTASLSYVVSGSTFKIVRTLPCASIRRGRTGSASQQLYGWKEWLKTWAQARARVTIIVMQWYNSYNNAINEMTTNKISLMVSVKPYTGPSRGGGGGVRGVRTNHPAARGGPLFWWCLFHGTERNAVLFHGTDKCDNGTINLILEYLTRNRSI